LLHIYFGHHKGISDLIAADDGNQANFVSRGSLFLRKNGENCHFLQLREMTAGVGHKWTVISYNWEKLFAASDQTFSQLA
jgi:hypothetical protein